MSRIVSSRLSHLLERWGPPVLLLLLLGFYLPSWFGGISFYHDDSLYILTGRALSQGHGYRIESVPGAPAETKYPILFPALLSLLWKVDGEYPANTVLFRAVNTLIWLGALWIFYRFLVRFRYASPATSLLVTALWGFSGMAVSAAGMVLSEPLCTFLMVAALWYCEIAVEREGARSRLPALVAGVFCGLTFLSRTAALLLIAAFVWTLFRRNRLASGWSLVGATPFIAAWLAWSRNHPHLEPWDLRLHYLDYVRWSIWQYQLTPWPLGIYANVLQLVFFAIPTQVVYGVNGYAAMQASWPGALAVYAIGGTLVSLIVIAGAVNMWRSGRPLLPLAALLMTIPAILQPTGVLRYLTPVGGIVIYLFFRGFEPLVNRFCRGATLRRAAWGLAGVALGWNLFLAGRDFAGRYSVMGAPPSSIWQAAFDWVEKNIPPNEAILCENDPLLFLLTGRKGISDRNAMRIVWTDFYPHWEGVASHCPDPDKQLAEVRSMNIHWALDVGDPNAEKGFGFPSIIRARPDAFQLYFTAGPGTFHVYKLK